MSRGAAHHLDEVFSHNRHFSAQDTALKHGSKGRTVGGRQVSRGPTRGQHALDHSEQISPNSPRRIGIDVDNNEIVIFDRTGNAVRNGQAVGVSYHGHVRSYNDLSQAQKNVLRNAGVKVSRNGTITLD